MRDARQGTSFGSSAWEKLLLSTLRAEGPLPEVVMRWSPLIRALIRLGRSALTLTGELRRRAQRGDTPIWRDELLAELRQKLHEVVDASPELTDFFFDLDHVDAIITSVLRDDDSRDALNTALQSAEAHLDRGLQRLIAAALDPDHADLRSDQLLDFISSIESILEEAIERWLIPTVLDARPPGGAP